jgi:HEAT repeat protein
MLVELLSWLGLVGGDVAFYRLIDETDAAGRARLLRLLTQLGSAGMEAAREHLTDERWFVVRNACVVLGDLGDPDMPRQLQGALRHADGRVQQAAVAALIKNRTGAATAALADALPGLDPHIAEFALEEILVRKDPAAVEGLERFLQTSKGAKSGILGVVVNALAVVPSEHSARVLAAVLTDTSYPPPVRRAAADALLHNPLPSVRRALIAFASQASDDPIAAGLQRALERDAPH